MTDSEKPESAFVSGFQFVRLSVCPSVRLWESGLTTCVSERTLDISSISMMLFPHSSGISSHSAAAAASTLEASRNGTTAGFMVIAVWEPNLSQWISCPTAEWKLLQPPQRPRREKGGVSSLEQQTHFKYLNHISAPNSLIWRPSPAHPDCTVNSRGKK